MAEEEPQPKPRLLDTLLELYIKIGGYIGVALSAGVFVAVCTMSFWMFYGLNIQHFRNGVLDFIVLLATLIAASLVAVTTFFCASVFWLPILIGLFILWSLFAQLLVKLHH